MESYRDHDLKLSRNYIQNLSDAELDILLITNHVASNIIYALIELVSRYRVAISQSQKNIDKLIKEVENLTKTNTDLKKRVASLEDKTLKKAGRKKQTFNIDGKELTDDYLVYIIDHNMATLGSLEKIVGAGKNVLRNRYNKAKNKQQLERQVQKNDNP